MLTFDQVLGAQPTNDAELKAMLKGSFAPDRVECGENNDYWIWARKSTQKVELVSKQTGKIAGIASYADIDLYTNLSDKQKGVIRSALGIK